MKKILFVSRPIAPPWDEASKNFAYNLSKETAASNPDLEIHIMTKGKLDSLPANVIQEDIYTSSEKDFRLLQKIRLFWFLFRNAKKFDVLHLFFTPTKINSFFIKLLKGETKTIQTIATLREDILSDSEIKKIMFGDIITTYSEYARNKLRNLGFGNTKKVYPGINLKDYYPREKSENLLRQCSFDKNNFIINFSGEYVRLGGIDNVIDSFIGVSKKIPAARLSLSVRVKNKRDAEKKEEVVKKLKENNLLEKVSFHNDGNYKMSDIFNLCDVSLFTVINMKGKFDVPLVAIEAMACEKPVIISDIPILSEFSNEENSIQVKSGNTQEIISAILSLYNDKEKNIYLRTYARKYVEENFNIKKASQKYSEIYKNL